MELEGQKGHDTSTYYKSNGSSSVPHGFSCAEFYIILRGFYAT
jgi:hypothetical protein